MSSITSLSETRATIRTGLNRDQTIYNVLKGLTSDFGTYLRKHAEQASTNKTVTAALNHYPNIEHPPDFIAGCITVAATYNPGTIPHDGTELFLNKLKTGIHTLVDRIQEHFDGYSQDLLKAEYNILQVQVSNSISQEVKEYFERNLPPEKFRFVGSSKNCKLAHENAFNAFKESIKKELNTRFNWKINDYKKEKEYHNDREAIVKERFCGVLSQLNECLYELQKNDSDSETLNTFYQTHSSSQFLKKLHREFNSRSKLDRNGVLAYLETNDFDKELITHIKDLDDLLKRTLETVSEERVVTTLFLQLCTRSYEDIRRKDFRRFVANTIVNLDTTKWGWENHLSGKIKSAMPNYREYADSAIKLMAGRCFKLSPLKKTNDAVDKIKQIHKDNEAFRDRLINSGYLSANAYMAVSNSHIRQPTPVKAPIDATKTAIDQLEKFLETWNPTWNSSSEQLTNSEPDRQNYNSSSSRRSSSAYSRKIG
jgi:hypothetical protein